MLKERHRYRAPTGTSRRRSNIVPLENVSIVPGNRFILLPLKKVSTIVRRHRCCRSGSATSTKACIVQKATTVPQPVLFQPTAGGANKSVNRSARRLKRRHPPVVKTCLSPVSEQDQEDINFIVGDYIKPVDTAVGPFECSKRVETEWLLQVQADSRQSPRSSRSKKGVHHKQGGEGLSLSHEENGPRLGVDSNTKSYDANGHRAELRETSSLRDRKTLDQRLEQAKAHEKGLELGALQRGLHTRTRTVRQLSGDSALAITKNQNFNGLVDEVHKRIEEARFRDNHAALKQEKGARHQHSGNKRLHKIAVRIHTSGRNRVSPSSGSVGHKAFQVRSVVDQQQFVLPPPMPENSANRRSRRVRSCYEDFHGVSYADVQPEQTFSKWFLYSCTSSDDLPIGPLRTLEEDRVN